jgi:hypothetical protein
MDSPNQMVISAAADPRVGRCAPGRSARRGIVGDVLSLEHRFVVDELAAARLAERQPDEADGRSSFAVLTPAGKNALRRAWPVYREAIRRRLGAHLTARQCRQLAALLEHAVAGAETGICRKAGR